MRSLASARSVCSVFFFQAEDGIRYLTVTGVQTCALPICRSRFECRRPYRRRSRSEADTRLPVVVQTSHAGWRETAPSPRRGEACATARRPGEIGRASCRGRVEISVGGGLFKKKKRKKDLM